MSTKKDLEATNTVLNVKTINNDATTLGEISSEPQTGKQLSADSPQQLGEQGQINLGKPQYGPIVGLPYNQTQQGQVDQSALGQKSQLSYVKGEPQNQISPTGNIEISSQDQNQRFVSTQNLKKQVVWFFRANALFSVIYLIYIIVVVSSAIPGVNGDGEQNSQFGDDVDQFGRRINQPARAATMGCLVLSLTVWIMLTLLAFKANNELKVHKLRLYRIVSVLIIIFMVGFSIAYQFITQDMQEDVETNGEIQIIPIIGTVVSIVITIFFWFKARKLMETITELQKKFGSELSSILNQQISPDP